MVEIAAKAGQDFDSLKGTGPNSLQGTDRIGKVKLAHAFHWYRHLDQLIRCSEIFQRRNDRSIVLERDQGLPWT